MWAQKARSNQILQGDRNIKFFQTVVRQRSESYKSRMIQGALLKILMKLRPSSLITLSLAFRIQFSQVLIALFRNFNPSLFLLSPLNNLLPLTNPLLLQRLKNLFFKLVPTKLLGLMAFLLFSSINIRALSKLKLSVLSQPSFIQVLCLNPSIKLLLLSFLKYHFQKRFLISDLLVSVMLFTKSSLRSWLIG